MGTCLSKKRGSSNGIAGVTPGTVPDLKCINNGGTTAKPTRLLQTENQNELKWGKKTQLKNGNQEKEAEKELKDENPIVVKKELKDENPVVVKKEIFVIRHRKSHDKSSDQTQQHNALVSPPAEGGSRSLPPDAALPPISGVVSKLRTSSCTKEEVDAILIQCGRLSRSSSSSKAAASTSSHHGRKYSGSKRSFDFDHSDKDALAVAAAAADDRDGDDRRNTDLVENDDDGDVPERRLRHRQRNRQSPRPSPSRERRRTHSRERDRNSQRERRVSRSPGRRSSETSGNSAVDNSITNIISHDSTVNNGGSRKPAKMVSVPATISSLAMEKSNNGCDSISATAIKRISVKRNAGDLSARVVSSPRSQSPARTIANGKVADENVQQHQPSLSRSSSRKAEQSPYRRNALSEIDPNSIPHSQAQNRVGGKSKKETESDGIPTINALNQKPKVETGMNGNVIIQGSTMAEPKMMEEEPTKVQAWMPEVAEPVKAQTLVRSRSARRSRDLDINPETLLNTTTSYTTLLLEDIQNFHQKNTPLVSLPPCLTKACSILEAVADLNSTTSSNLSCTFSEDRTSPVPPYQSSWNDYSASFGANLIGIDKEMALSREPFVESEVAVKDDVMEPSFHKYITVTRGGGDTEDQESSGSNSVTGSQQNRVFSSSQEPTSADTTLKSVNSKEEGQPSSARQRNGRTRKDNVRVKERLVPINLQ